MINRTILLDPAMTQRAQQREAEKQTNLLMAEYEQGKLAATKPITLKQLSEMFMEDYVRRKGLSPRTQLHYEQLLHSRILPTLGQMRIKDITPVILNHFYSALEHTQRQDGKGTGKLSSNYVAKYHMLLRNMLTRAVQWQLLATNPATRTEAPKVEQKEYRILENSESIILLDTLEKETPQWRALITLALFTQMRRGELIGLNWTQIDLERGTLNVVQSMYYLPGKGVLSKTPKTAASKRSIVLSSTALIPLKELRKEQLARKLALGDKWIDSGAVFVQWNGDRLHVDTPTKWLSKFLQRRGLPHVRSHDLRHTGASMLIAAGLDIQTVKRRLGHARASTTLDIYGHAFVEYDNRPADALEAFLARPKPSSNEPVVY